MAKINVNREVTDAFYRYKMPAIVAKVEGKGNGVRTVLPNLNDIAKSLERPSVYLLKFFGQEVGTQTQMEKQSQQEVCICYLCFIVLQYSPITLTNSLSEVKCEYN